MALGARLLFGICFVILSGTVNTLSTSSAMFSPSHLQLGPSPLSPLRMPEKGPVRPHHHPGWDPPIALGRPHQSELPRVWLVRGHRHLLSILISRFAGIIRLSSCLSVESSILSV